MSEKLKELTPQEARIKRAAVLRELADLYAEIERGDGEDGADNSSAPNAQSYVRLPLTDAILLYLATCKDAPTTKEIWRALERAGRESESQNPVRSVRHALKTLLATNDDLFHIGWARWHLKSKYTSAKLRKLLSGPQNGTGGHSPEEHSTRTRAGLEKAKARGRRLGAKPKYTADHIAQLKALLAAGSKVKHALDTVGVKPAWFYLYRPQIEAWKLGEPWPPIERHPLAGIGVEEPPSLFNAKGPPMRLVRP